MHEFLPCTHANMLAEKVWVTAHHSTVTYSPVGCGRGSVDGGYYPTESDCIRSQLKTVLITF